MVLRQHAHGEASVVWLSPSAAGLARSESAKQATEGRDVGTTRRVPLRTMLRRGEAVLLPEQSQDQATEVLLAGAAERPSRTGPAALDWQAENALPSDMSSGDIHAVLPDSLGGPGRQCAEHLGDGRLRGVSPWIADAAPPDAAPHGGACAAVRHAAAASLRRRRVGGRVRRRASLVGQWVSVHWVADRRWYSGQVRGYSASMQVRTEARNEIDGLPGAWAMGQPYGERACLRGKSLATRPRGSCQAPAAA